MFEVGGGVGRQEARDSERLGGRLVLDGVDSRG
jgi:hypothetical protein